MFFPSITYNRSPPSRPSSLPDHYYGHNAHPSGQHKLTNSPNCRSIPISALPGLMLMKHIISTMNTPFFWKDIWLWGHLRQHEAAIFKPSTLLFMCLSNPTPSSLSVSVSVCLHVCVCVSVCSLTLSLQSLRSSASNSSAVPQCHLGVQER